MTVYAQNKKATFDYEILETFEAGIELKGHEVKAIKAGKVSIKGTYVKVLGKEIFLLGANVSPYQPGNVPKDYEAQRDRKLLLTKKELNYLIGKQKEKGLTIVPIKLYNKRGKVKLEIGVARGKKKYDKREAIKKRDVERRLRRGEEI
jgi:SsrA-binding protein